MSRKGTIAIIIFILVLLGLLGGFYYYLQIKSDTPGSTKKGFDIRDYFPFGKGPATPTGIATNPDNNTSNQNNNQQNPDVSNTNPPVLRQITKFPIAGSIIFDRVISTTTVASTTNKKKTFVRKETKNVIRYMERSNGNIHETATDTTATLRVSNTTFPKVYEALFDFSGENVIARTILNDDAETISTYYGHLKPITPTSTEEMLETTLLSDSVDTVVTSPLKDKIFSMGSTGGEKGLISAFDGSKKSVVFTSLLREWLPTWASDNTIVLSTKPSYGVESSAYFLDTTTKSFKKVGTSLPGLTVSASPNLAYLLYAQSDVKNKSIIFGLMDRGGKEPTPLFLKTLPEKCVWSLKEKTVAFCAVPDSIPGGNYPDDWYMGKITFSDSIWKINVVTGEVRDIAPIREMVREDIDAINLSLDSKEDYMLFTNKKDLTLWGLQLKPTVSSTTASTTT